MQEHEPQLKTFDELIGIDRGDAAYTTETPLKHMRKVIQCAKFEGAPHYVASDSKQELERKFIQVIRHYCNHPLPANWPMFGQTNSSQEREHIK